MKIISPDTHGYLDFATVVIFLLAPTLFGLSGVPAMLAYALAVIHLLVTIGTNFPSGVAKILPFTLHGWIERVVGPVLIVSPFILGFADVAAARNFYILIGIIIILVGVFTDYQKTTS
ncbi:MAG: SPW repeat domain-containing protein [Methylobacter sp.]